MKYISPTYIYIYIYIHLGQVHIGEFIINKLIHQCIRNILNLV